jgi:hypothetical protein
MQGRSVDDRQVVSDKHMLILSATVDDSVRPGCFMSHLINSLRLLQDTSIVNLDHIYEDLVDAPGFPLSSLGLTSTQGERGILLMGPYIPS